MYDCKKTRMCFLFASEWYDVEDRRIDIIVRLLVIDNHKMLYRTLTSHMEGSLWFNLDLPNGYILSLIVDNIFLKGY